MPTEQRGIKGRKIPTTTWGRARIELDLRIPTQERTRTRMRAQARPIRTRVRVWVEMAGFIRLFPLQHRFYSIY
ncbi:hypothetical protein [Pandoravirus japonicus]|uniref:Uncharacterized protein n=1 Tax=Pandoravirus japonicus TaxID=2823154 RepID=A0A811BPT8_9VIRU|nr:hypothetical protein [Pandoravirus japonicus]